MRKIVSVVAKANIKQQEIKKLVPASHKFYKKYLYIQFKKGKAPIFHLLLVGISSNVFHQIWAWHCPLGTWGWGLGVEEK